ncbi:MAG: hypothetical protein HC918_04495 [Oscillatoriales cyanobacterium SM2_1_8]|nr:hypothetical protein [Oscillatoriales cyanobacterium SM2_1_8]
MTREQELATGHFFRQEAHEYVNAIHDALLDLLEAPANGEMDRLDGVLHSARSLREEAAQADWRGIAKLIQRLEESLQRMKLGRPHASLKFRNLWRQVLGTLRAAIDAQTEGTFADRIGVEAVVAEALDRLELYFTQDPASEASWEELERCLQLLNDLRLGWQEAAEAQADLVALRESLAEIGMTLPAIAAIGQWFDEASVYCHDLTSWQDLGEQTAQRLHQVCEYGDGSDSGSLLPADGDVGDMGRANSSLLNLLDFGTTTDDQPFEFPDVNDTDLFDAEEDDPFAIGSPPNRLFEAGQETAPDPFVGAMTNSPFEANQAAIAANGTVAGLVGEEPGFAEEESPVESFGDLSFWDEAEIFNEFEEGAAEANLGDLGFLSTAELTQEVEEEFAEANLSDLGFLSAPEPSQELEEESAVESLGDLNFFGESESPEAFEEESAVASLGDLGFLGEAEPVQELEESALAMELDGLLTELDPSLPTTDELSPLAPWTP